MTSAINLLLLTALLIPLWWQLRRDFIKGLAYAVFLCVSMSTYLRISLPGALPELTIFRLVLILLFLSWLRQDRSRQPKPEIPCASLFWFWAIANLFSLLLTSVNFVDSLKRYLDFIIEIWGFYLIVITSLRTREDAMKILHAAVAGVGLVALLAFVEKYSGLNPVNFILSSGEGFQGGRRDVVATYQHRILLGTGMAMGFPLAFVLATRATTGHSKRWLWILTLLLAAGCYFAQSRGPWIGAILAGATVWLLGSSRLRRAVLWPLALTVLVLMARPGVYTTLFNSAKVTADADSFKGGTFQYRLELWRVAWNEVTKDPVRLLFGYGPGCGVDRTVEWSLSYRGNDMDIWSWDNHYAYDLYQSGVVGLAARLALYLGVAAVLFGIYRRVTHDEKDLLAALCASALVMVFMMSNVLIFSKQLNFLFWALVAVGFTFRLSAQAAINPDIAGSHGEEPASGPVGDASNSAEVPA